MTTTRHAKRKVPPRLERLRSGTGTRMLEAARGTECEASCVCVCVVWPPRVFSNTRDTRAACVVEEVERAPRKITLNFIWEAEKKESRSSVRCSARPFFFALLFSPIVFLSLSSTCYAYLHKKTNEAKTPTHAQNTMWRRRASPPENDDDASQEAAPAAGASPAEAYGFVGFVLTGRALSSTRHRSRPKETKFVLRPAPPPPPPPPTLSLSPHAHLLAPRSHHRTSVCVKT